MYVYENIWNRIGKGKYKLSHVLWVGMWVRKKLVERYLHKKTQYQLRRTSVEGHVPDPTRKIAQIQRITSGME